MYEIYNSGSERTRTAGYPKRADLQSAAIATMRHFHRLISTHPANRSMKL